MISLHVPNLSQDGFRRFTTHATTMNRPSSAAYEEAPNGAEHREGDSPPLMVYVTAPATLPAGYTFEAHLNGDPSRTFTCEVPEDGVQEGQTFLAALPSDFPGPRLEAPTGAWKDQWYDCFKYGLFQPHLWCAAFCPQLLMAQVMQRMQLTWLGEPGPISSTRNSFKIVLTVVVVYCFYSSALGMPILPHSNILTAVWFPHFRFWGGLLFALWFLYALCKTRENVRFRYSIEEEHCLGCEDCCCALACTCCTVSQLARHTGDYETYPSVCCSETGHPPGAPLTV